MIVIRDISAQPRADRGIVLAAICFAALVLPLDFSGVAAATPAIGRALGGSAIMLTWIVNVFMLAFGSTLLTAGALADAFGRKRVFMFGLAAFVAVSIAICLSPNLFVLDGLRAIQGVAAAATLAGGSAALAQEFEGAARTRAFSLLGTTFGTGLAFGPTIAGLLLEATDWRAIFLVGAAVGTVALVFGVPRMRETRDPDATGPDWPGAIAFTACLALLTAGLLQTTEKGESTLALLAGSGLALAIFLQIERRANRPMLDLSLFRFPRFIGVQMLPIATCYSYVVLLVLLPARFIGVESYRPVDAGILMLSLSLPMLVVPFATALLTRWIAPGPLSVLGLLVAAGGLVELATTAPDAPTVQIGLSLCVIGLGSPMPWGLMDGLSVDVVPQERAGMATGIFSTVRVAGEGIALAIVRAILATLLQYRLPSDPDASHAAAWAAAGDMTRAEAVAPHIGHHAIAVACEQAFGSLMYVLAGIVVVASLCVLVLLRPGGRSQ